MRFELNYDKKNKKLYVSKNVLVSAVILLLVVASFMTYSVYNKLSKSQLVEPKNINDPLGIAPADVTTLPKNGEEAAKVVIDKIKREYANKFTLIFFYDGYQEQNEALTHIQVLKSALDIVEPYKSLKDLIAFKIFTTEGEKCTAKGTDKKVLTCDPKMIESFQRLGIERFKLVILSPKEFVSASQNAHGTNTWITISTNQGKLTKEELKRWIGITFTQELGHSLGLKYEYSKSKPSDFAKSSPDGSTAVGTKPGKPNCAPDEQTAKDWWGNYISVFDKVGFFKGCAGSDNYIYPQKDTLMSDFPTAESYGRVSEDYLRAVISCFYGNKESIIFQAGFEATYSAKLKNCEEFKKTFPNFWNE